MARLAVARGRCRWLAPAVGLALLGGRALGAHAASGPAVELRLAPGDDLQAAVNRAGRIVLAPGVYDLAPVAFTDETCGNCADPAERVPATRGLLVEGRSLELRGEGGGETVLRTHAGYGILAIDAELRLEGVTVTAGVRDPDGRATDAAVVARRSRVVIDRCRIADNLGDPAVLRKTVVGVAGVAGREGSELTITNSQIVHNSWDGIALYRGAQAVIEGNLVDGLDTCRGSGFCGGRGVGIGVTWDGRARLRGNLVTRYWKGIGAFVNARVEAEQNVVEDILTWGMSLWDGGGENRPRAVFRGNAVHQTGACGMMLSRAAAGPPEPGLVVDNAVARSGQDPAFDRGEPYCPQRAIAWDPLPPGLRLERNLQIDNREPGDCPGAADQPRPELAALCAGLAGWRWPRSSAFFQVYCRSVPHVVGP